MPEPLPYSYAVVRLVPRVEREEFINVGVLVYCQPARFLRARVALDEARLASLWPTADLALMREQLAAFVEVAHGTAPSPISRLSVSERFHWLASARSTMVQVSPVHTGLCVELEVCFDKLMRQYVQQPL